GLVEAVDPLVANKTMVVDSIGIVTIHDGPSLAPGEIIAPSVGNDAADVNYHNNYQDPDAFLCAGGRRGRQYVPLTDGTYFIHRFGDVKKLITQTLDPMLSAFFRDVAHKKTMLELLQHRDVIQNEARSELQRRFREFDIECVDVLIGKPDTAEAGGKIETLLEQLRIRQLSIEQLETFDRQKAASEKLRTLKEAEALAN